MREVLAEARTLLTRSLPCALCTVVETRGSTPQKAGATMLVRGDGTQAGTLGGGCVEAEVRRRALHRLASGENQSSLHEFLLDGDYGWDDGLICGGRMRVLVDPLRADDAAWHDYLTHRMACLDADSGSVELIRVAGDDPTLGQRWLFADQQLIATWPAGLAAEPARTRLPAPTARPRPSCTDGWAVLPMAAPITLLIVGGGHVGQTVARLAAEVDFHVWILDDRDRYASEERFPQARRRLVGPIGLTLTELTQQQITARTYAVIVTRGHDHDEEALFHLAPSAAGYVGMIGSRRKVRLILTELRERGVPETALARVCAPLGLRIGSQTVPEIAISIVAELIARRNLGTVIVSDGNTETNHRGTEDTEESSTERTTP